MISIICPVYNSAEYIKNTIKSLLDQNNVDENIEIVFIDDMSTTYSDLEEVYFLGIDK